MEIIKYQENENLDAALRDGEPFLAVISFDGSRAIIGHVDECMEHHILLAKAGLPASDIDRYFRVVFDRDGADWTFVCPSDYRNIDEKTRRITRFYKDGFTVISEFLAALGLLVEIRIPRRYGRHIMPMTEG